MVTFAHSYNAFYGWFYDPLKAYPTISKLFKLFTENLSIGVQVFFVISGFLITYLLLKEKESFGNVNIFKFIVRRSLRIWPLYYLSILVGYFFIKISDHSAPDYMAVLLFYNNFHIIHIKDWQFPFAHYWSIAVEEHFYLIWPFIIYFTSFKNVPFVIATFIGLSILTRFYFASYSIAPFQLEVQIHTLSRIDEILIGALLALFHYKYPIELNIDKKTRLLIYGFFVFLLLIDNINNFEIGIVGVLFKKFVYLGFIVFWICNYLFNKDAFFNFKKKNVLHYFGKISFGLYIYHNMIFDFYIKDVIMKYSLENIFIFELLYLIIVILMATISYELFEKHFIKLKHHFELIKTSR